MARVPSAAVLEALPLAAAIIRARLSRGETLRASPEPAEADPLWTPLPGPQMQAFESEADEIYYGGGAGGGKTEMLLGYGLTRARFGIIFRRQFKQLLGPEGIIERSKAVTGQPQAFNNSTMIWRLGDRQLEFGACDHEDDKYKYQGRAHDFKGFDEVAQFSESQYVYLSGWARTTAVGQRVRIIACGNPPQNTEGEWVIQRWAPWLDEEHKNPAKPGELRWFARTRGGSEIEVDGPDSVTIDGEVLTPKSRTFIPARVQDNPYLMATNYLAQLQQLPEPLRSQLIYGDHAIGLQDDEWQIIPAAWVRAAQARWTPERPEKSQQDQLGCDIAQGGLDRTIIARRYGTWFAEPECHDGRTVPDPQHNADHIERALLAGGVAEIDSDGLGAATYHLLAPTFGARVRAYRGSKPTKARDRSRVLTFANTRAAAWWAMRDALDPSYGLNIALPPLRELRVDLCSARYERLSHGIKVEDKDAIKGRLGRSPDLGDAYVMANWASSRGIGEALGNALSGSREPTLRDRIEERRARRQQAEAGAWR